MIQRYQLLKLVSSVLSHQGYVKDYNSLNISGVSKTSHDLACFCNAANFDFCILGKRTHFRANTSINFDNVCVRLNSMTSQGDLFRFRSDRSVSSALFVTGLF